MNVLALARAKWAAMGGRNRLLAYALGGTMVVAAPMGVWWQWGYPAPPPPTDPVDTTVYKYVRTDGSNSNNGLANTSGGAYLTIDYALDNASAGDIIRVQAGTYAQTLTPAVSGTAGNPITIVADGAATFCNITVTSKNYIRIIGFTIDTDAGGCTKANRAVQMNGTNTGWEFWNNTIRDAGSLAIGTGVYADRHHNFIVIGNTFMDIGPNGAAIRMRGDNNFFAYNEITGIDPDAFLPDGNYSYWLNNYSHDLPITDPNHGDGFQTGSSSIGLKFNLFESNLVFGENTTGHEHGALIQDDGVVSCSTGTCDDVTENLFRRNIWHNISSFAFTADAASEGPITATRIVHDTFALVMQNSTPTNVYGVLFRDSNTAHIWNSVFYEAWGPSASVSLSPFYVDTGASITTGDYNLAFDTGATPTYAALWTGQAHELTDVNPLFTNVASDDFTLQSGSGARNTAGALTTTSGSGTGTTFTVATGGGGFFRGPNANISLYGGGLTAGDVITVGGDVVTVASVSGDAITVTSSFTWANAEAVYLGDDTTPDVGAFPYNAGGYTLTATYSIAGSTITVTPSDASLVRMVVCYEAGIPKLADSVSPFTCTRTGGALVVRVYPRYAVATRYVTATEG